jgi:hypothetical protein
MSAIALVLSRKILDCAIVFSTENCHFPQKHSQFSTENKEMIIELYKTLTSIKTKDKQFMVSHLLPIQSKELS